MNKFYVYAHMNEQYGIFYVGKGCGKRLYDTNKRSDFWKRIVKKHGYGLTILECFLNESDAFESEIKWIAYYKSKGMCCANFTNGGDGVRVDKRWWNEKISAALTGKKCASGKASKSYKDFIDEDTLRYMYEKENKSIVFIGDFFGISYPTVTARLRQYGIMVRSIKERGKKIICVNTGEKFNSITEAAKKHNVFRENIRKVLSGKYKTTGGLTFKYGE